MESKKWHVVKMVNSHRVVAVQHGCGADDHPVNCFLDEYRNWVCPHCMATYGAELPFMIVDSAVLIDESEHSTKLIYDGSSSRLNIGK